MAMAEKVETGKARTTGRVWLLGAGPGDPDLITWRGVLLLRKAEVVLHDALSHPELLELCPQAEIVDVGKRYGRRATPQDEITELLLRFAGEGKRVVRLKGGDPLMFARGSEEALALSAAGIPFEIVPGVTSAVAASAFAGISLTHRDASSSVTFITGSDRQGKEWSPDAWKKLATATGTICVYMGMRRIDAITQAIIEGGRSPQTPAAVVRWGGRPQQQTVVGSLSNIADRAREADLQSPAIIIVGEVVSLRKKLRWYDNQPLFGKRVLIPRPSHQGRETAAALRARGAAPVLCPAIEIVDGPDPGALRKAVADAYLFDWVVFTSSNGVDAFFKVAISEGRDGRLFGRARIATIGPKTAEALARHGLRADLTAQSFVAESLIEALLAESTRGSRILIPRAEEAREILPEQLRQNGCEVRVVAAYRTRGVSGAGQERLRNVIKNEVDIVLLTSSSMVDSVIAALGPDARNLLSGCTVACIGPITRDAALGHGLKVDVEAEIYTVEGLLDALERHYSLSTDAAQSAIFS